MFGGGIDWLGCDQVQRNRRGRRRTGRLHRSRDRVGDCRRSGRRGRRGRPRRLWRNAWSLPATDDLRGRRGRRGLPATVRFTGWFSVLLHGERHAQTSGLPRCVGDPELEERLQMSRWGRYGWDVMLLRTTTPLPFSGETSSSRRSCLRRPRNWRHFSTIEFVVPGGQLAAQFTLLVFDFLRPAPAFGRSVAEAIGAWGGGAGWRCGAIRFRGEGVEVRQGIVVRSGSVDGDGPRSATRPVRSVTSRAKRGLPIWRGSRRRRRA